jgi:hypothetical protein
MSAIHRDITPLKQSCAAAVLAAGCRVKSSFTKGVGKRNVDESAFSTPAKGWANLHDITPAPTFTSTAIPGSAAPLGSTLCSSSRFTPRSSSRQFTSSCSSQWGDNSKASMFINQDIVPRHSLSMYLQCSPSWQII